MQLTLTTAALFAGLVVAQDLSLINQLPNCGKTCINNMLGKAQSLGCQPNDIACLCKNMDFGNGVHDCSAESCPQGTDINTITSTGMQFCAAALANSSGSGSAGVTASTTAVVSSGISTVVGSQTVVTTTGTGSMSTVTGLSTGIAGATPIVGAGTTGSSTGMNSTGGNSTSGKTGGVVVTSTNSAGSTILSTMAPSSTSGGSGGSGSGSSTARSGGSPTTSGSTTSSSGASSADTVKVAAAGFAGFAGLAAFVLL
ncbi:hypothetical protein N7G274_008153 [Stereocaulon virgatum]|uniref:CFEM domain-containing protein n=1 Tax=Stereocaulon virgatum TaxID=373712 RepID=A0ABR3ZZI8_9LECA